MADVNKDIQISLKLDDQGAVAGIQAVNGAAVRLGKEGASGASQFGDTMKIALGNIAASAAEQLAMQMGELISQGARLVGRAAEIAETQDKFNVIFGDSADVVSGFVDEQARLMGLTDQQAQELLATAASVAQGAGVAQDASAELSVRVGKLAGDLASFNDAAPQETFDALISGLTGEREQLKQYGIVLQESEVQRRALQMTQKESAKQLTQEEKLLASLELMYAKAGRQVGNLEDTADSAANTQKQMNATYAQLRDEFAQQLLPVATEVYQELLKLAENEEVIQGVRDAARALAEQLIRGVELGSAFVRLLVDNRSEIKTSAQVVATLGAAVATYVATTKAQAAATQLAILWEKRAAIARLASMRAQKALNLAMRMNPVGLIITALTVVIPLIYKFRSQLMDAAASVLDFGAKAIRGLQGVVDWFQKIADKIPEAWLKVDPVMRGLVNAINGADTAVDATAGKMEEWAMGLRASADAAEGARVSIVDSKSAMESQADIFDENTDQTESNTAAVDDNTDAVERNAAARKAANEIPPRPTPTVEPEDETLDAPDVSMEADLDLITGNSLGGIERLLREGMIDSISETDRAIQELQRQFNNASTAEARRQIQALILTLQQQRNEMTSVAQDTSLSFQQIAGAVQGFAGQMAGALQALQETAVGRSKAMFAVYKAVAITEAIVSTYLAANKAMAETPGPPPIPQIAAATVVASGLANVAKIKSARPKGAGAGGGGGDRRVEAPAVPRMRKGGRVESGGPVLVGDGPGGRITPYTELFMPDQPGRIIPRSGLNVTSGAASSGGNRHIIDKLDAVQRAFEQKQFRLQGTDQVTQQQRVMSEFSTAGIE